MTLGHPIRLALLGIVNLGLLAGIAFAWQRGESLIAQVDTLPTRASPIPTLALTIPPARASIYPVIQNQALFHRTRTFYTPPAPNTAPVLPPLPDYVFAGAMAPPGGKAVAALRDPQTSALVRVRVGDTISNWSVRIVDLRRVVVEFEGTQREFAATRTASAATGTGLRSVTLVNTRTPLAAGEVRNLGAGPSGVTTAMAGVADNTPRLYRPPPPP